MSIQSTMESEEHLHLEDPSHDEDGMLHEQLSSLANEHGPKRGKKGRPAIPPKYKKAPNAPKRFKSSYICFFMAKQTDIKNELGDHATVSNISRRSAEMWKTLSAEEREHWDAVAARDKERYMMEKAIYTGPWQVPWKRAKKDPSAPKRPMSAFLYFSQGRRSQIKEENPDLRNTQVSRILGEMWRNLSDEERRPHLEKEKEQREKYKVAMTEWKQENEIKQAAQQNAETERHIQMHRQSMNIQEAQAQLLADPFGPQSGLVPNPYMPMPPMGFNPHSIFAPGPLNFPVNGKPVILGPDGTPVFQSSPGNPPAPIVVYPPPPHLDDGIPNLDYTGTYAMDADVVDSTTGLLYEK